MNSSRPIFETISIEWPVIPWPLVLIACAAAIWWSVWYYRNTVPPVEGWLRRLLTGLRITALVLAILLAAGPVIHLQQSVTRQSVIAVLMDTSASISPVADSGRGESALSALAVLRDHLGSSGAFYGFDTAIRPLSPDDQAFFGTGTDISMALASVTGDPDVSDVVLLSDGRWNLGHNPEAMEFPADIPIHTVTLGSTDIPGDIVIDGLSAPSVGRAGDSLHVEVAVSSQAGITGSVPVTITGQDGETVTGHARFDGTSRSSVSFDIPLAAQGDMTFTAEISPDEDFSDITRENNRRSFDVHILKRNFNILLIAGKPSADLAFLRRAIDSVETLSLDVVISEGIRGQAKSELPSSLGRYDAIILMDGGGPLATDTYVSGTLLPWLAGGKGLWVLGSTLPDKSGALASLLPVTLDDNGLIDGDAVIVRTEAGRSHAVTTVPSDINPAWDNLPPVPSLFRVGDIRPGGMILAAAVDAVNGAPDIPALVSGIYGSGKVLLMPVSGFWRWKLMLEGTGQDGTFYTTFVTSAARWLAVESDISPLDISTDKRTYLGGEEIRVTARPHDAVFTPVPGAEVSLTVDGDPATKTILRETGPAEYTGTLRGITAGEHTLEVSAFNGDISLGEAAAPVTVQSFSLEQLDIRPNFPLMSTLAEKTGGETVTGSGIQTLLPRLAPDISTERRENRSPLRGKLILLILTVLALTVEWSIRKRLGML